MTSPRTVGEDLEGFNREVTQERVSAYANASGDHNPIHLDAEFAASTRFGATYRAWDVESGVRLGDDGGELS